jgi:hypothetical protein
MGISLEQPVDTHHTDRAIAAPIHTKREAAILNLVPYGFSVYVFGSSLLLRASNIRVSASCIDETACYMSLDSMPHALLLYTVGSGALVYCAEWGGCLLCIRSGGKGDLLRLHLP